MRGDIARLRLCLVHRDDETPLRLLWEKKSAETIKSDTTKVNKVLRSTSSGIRVTRTTTLRGSVLCGCLPLVIEVGDRASASVVSGLSWSRTGWMADRCLRLNFMIWRVRWKGQSRTDVLLGVESRHFYMPSHRTRLLLLLVSTFLGRHSGPAGDCFHSRARLQSKVFPHKRDQSRELPFHGVRHRALPRPPSCVQAITAVPYVRPTTPLLAFGLICASARNVMIEARLLGKPGAYHTPTSSPHQRGAFHAPGACCGSMLIAFCLAGAVQ